MADKMDQYDFLYVPGSPERLDPGEWGARADDPDSFQLACHGCGESQSLEDYVMSSRREADGSVWFRLHPVFVCLRCEVEGWANLWEYVDDRDTKDGNSGGGDSPAE